MRFESAIGRGVLAGLAGTVAMTAYQALDLSYHVVYGVKVAA